MANKHSSKDKHKKKHKKEKSKKHKKEKKLKKVKKEKSSKKSYSSDSSSSGSSSESEGEMKKEIQQEPLKKQDWGFFDAVLNDSNVTVKDKKVKETRSNVLDQPGQSDRELNPYWKDGGCGLPPTKPEQESRNRYESFSKNFSNSTDRYRDTSYRSRTGTQMDFSNGTREKKLSFLKPGEGSSSFAMHSNTFQRNWKKKELKEPESKKEEKLKPPVQEDEINETATSSKALSGAELNKLAAKVLRAEIMGNTALASKLKAELEAAKKLKEQTPGSGEKGKEVVIITERGTKKSNEDVRGNVPSKRQKVSSQASREKLSYFADEKYSLKNLFEKEKAGHEEEMYLPRNLQVKNSEEFDDVYLDATASDKVQQKIEDRKNKKSKEDAIAKHKTLEGCRWCLDNRNRSRHLIVSTGKKCYLCLPEEDSLTKGHCLIVPLQHEISMMHLDEDVWEEVKTYQKVLAKMFLQMDQDVIFFENARSFKHFPHCYIQCVPLEKELGDVAPIYFQKAISESETEWSNNKKVVDFRQKDLRRSIPKGLPYFAVSFGTEGGFAHIIEDEFLFKRNFAEEVIGGMLDLDPKKWRKPQRENYRAQKEKALEFLKTWKQFEFNENLAESESSSSSESSDE